jgi:hypothetical protein
MAVLPGLVVVALATGWMAYHSVQFSRVSNVIVPAASRTPSAGKLKCVETYGITLKTSEFYVSEGIERFRRPKHAPRELSTVVQGMARNGCGEPLKNVRILINVRDDQGRRGTGWAKVGNLGTGQAAAFERAWIGRVTSYDIVEVR